MTKQEAAKLLSLIKLSYPTAYRDIDKETANATVMMWASSFPDIPYQIMEVAFNHFRMVSKFPPTVAEMVEELKHIHYQAIELALINKSVGNEEEVLRYQAIMNVTSRYKDLDSFWGQLQNNMLGGVTDVQRLGTSGDRMGNENRLPFLEAGEGRR
jgi:hypothetical protein